MTDSFPADDLAVGRLIRRLADVETRDRDPREVARVVIARAERRRRGWLPFAAIAATLAVVGVVVALAMSSSVIHYGSSPASARVRGLTYGISVARSIDLSEAELTPFGEATQNSGFLTEDGTAFRVDQLDPEQVLVLKLAPGERDDAGSIGNHLVLIRGDGFSLLCDYFAADDPLAPSVCN
jgi:hypothetical protein